MPMGPSNLCYHTEYTAQQVPATATAIHQYSHTATQPQPYINTVIQPHSHSHTSVTSDHCKTRGAGLGDPSIPDHSKLPQMVNTLHLIGTLDISLIYFREVH